MSTRTHVLDAEGQSALTAVAEAAPSLVGDRSCRLLFRPERVDVWAAPPAIRTPGRPSVISCGAAVFDLSVAIRAFGRMTAVHVLPLRSEPRLIAAVHIGREREPTWRDRQRHEAMTDPDGYQTRTVEMDGFWSDTMGDLEKAASEGSARLSCLTRPQLHKVSDVLSEAGRGIGIEPLGALDRAGCAGTHARTAVLSTRHDDPAGWVWAGVAWRRVLLTATTLGLTTSCVGALLDSGNTRWRIQEALGYLDWPQVVLRFGLRAAVVSAQPLGEAADLAS
jgi:hypothetical protein